MPPTRIDPFNRPVGSSRPSATEGAPESRLDDATRYLARQYLAHYAKHFTFFVRAIHEVRDSKHSRDYFQLLAQAQARQPKKSPNGGSVGRGTPEWPGVPNDSGKNADGERRPVTNEGPKCHALRAQRQASERLKRINPA